MKTANLFAVILAIGVTPALHADHHLKPVDLNGVWNVVASSDEGDSRKITWTFETDGKKLKGSSLDHENDNEQDLDRITVKEKKVTIEIDIDRDGFIGVIRVDAEEKTAGKLTGKWSVVGEDGTSVMSGELVALKEVSLAGEWDASSELPDGQILESVLRLKGKNKSLTGVLEGQSGEIELDKVSVTDAGVRVEFEFEMNDNIIEVVIKAKAKGSNELDGKWVVIGDDGSEAAEGKWSAKRKVKSLAGVWNVVAVVPDNADYTGTLTLTEKDGKYAGSSKGENSDERKLTTVTVGKKQIEFSIPFDQGGASGTITVIAKLKEDGSLDGEWALVGEDGQELGRDSWKATRK